MTMGNAELEWTSSLVEDDGRIGVNTSLFYHIEGVKNKIENIIETEVHSREKIIEKPKEEKSQNISSFFSGLIDNVTCPIKKQIISSLEDISESLEENKKTQEANTLDTKILRQINTLGKFLGLKGKYISLYNNLLVSIIKKNLIKITDKKTVERHGIILSELDKLIRSNIMYLGFKMEDKSIDENYNVKLGALDLDELISICSHNIDINLLESLFIFITKLPKEAYEYNKRKIHMLLEKIVVNENIRKKTLSDFLNNNKDTKDEYIMNIITIVTKSNILHNEDYYMLFDIKYAKYWSFLYIHRSFSLNYRLRFLNELTDKEYTIKEKKHIELFIDRLKSIK